MPYSSFTLERVRDQFTLTVHTGTLFADIVPQAPSAHLQVTLADQVPIALTSLTEKARSELIIAPLLVEVWRQVNRQITLFSGVTFDVAPQEELVGICDFLIVQEPNAAVVTAPVLAVVEAKNDDMRTGLGQCAAELVAAARYNQQRGSASLVYGAVTTGTAWRFLRLDGTTLLIEQREYVLEELDLLLGILVAICTPTESPA